MYKKCYFLGGPLHGLMKALRVGTRIHTERLPGTVLPCDYIAIFEDASTFIYSL